MDESPDRAGYGGPSVELRSSNGSEHVDQGRSVLARADASLFLIGLDGDSLDRMVVEQPLAETHRALRDAADVVRSLRILADEFETAGIAAREALEQANREHDKRQAISNESERPRLVAASSSRQGMKDPGPSRAC